MKFSGIKGLAPRVVCGGGVAVASGRVDSGSVVFPEARVTVRGDIWGCPKVAGGSPKLLLAAVLKLLTWRATSTFKCSHAVLHFPKSAVPLQ